MFSTPITKNITLYAKWEENKGAPEPEFGTTKYSVVFDSAGETEIEEQTVVEEGNAIRPDDPEKNGFVFLGWFDDEGYIYDFEAPVYSNIFLTAGWSALEEVTDEEAELFEEAYIGGEIFTSFDNSPITSVEVQYALDGIGTVEISEVTDNPMCNTTGLIGSPIEITAIGANVENAEIIFHYDPSKLAVAPNDLSIAWYDSSNDKVVLLSDDTVIDAENNVAKVLVNHFSMYGLVSKSQWLEIMWEKLLPTSEDVRYNIFIALDMLAGYKYIDIVTQPLNELIDSLSVGDTITVDIIYHTDAVGGPDDMYALSLINKTTINSDLDKTFVNNNLLLHDDRGRLLYDASAMNFGVTIGGMEFGFLSPHLGDLIAALNPAVLDPKKPKKYNVLICIPRYSKQFLLARLDIDFSSWDKRFRASQQLKHLVDNYNLKIITVDMGKELYEDNSPYSSYSYPTYPTYEEHVTNLQQIAAQTGGAYVKAEDFSNINKQLSKTFNKTDTDKDGLPDALEKEGMRDQYQKIWSTDFTLADTDGDGLSDDVEMGKYVTDFPPFYFRRFSNPNKTTRIENGSSCTLPSKINTAIKHRGEKMLYLTVNLKSFGYKDFKEYEAFFQPVKKLEFDITDLPEGFELKTKKIDSKENKRYIGGFWEIIDRDYTLTAGIAYEDESVELNAVNLKLTIDDMETYNELAIDHTETYVNSESLKKAKSAAARVTGAFIGELQNKARNVIEANAQDDNAANRLKKQITAYNTGLTNDGSTPPDEVYTAFARAVLRAIEDCNINDYSYKIDKMGVELILQVIKQLMGNRTRNYTFNINGLEYNVTFDIHTMSTTGAYTGFGSANISWYDKSRKEHKWLLTWTTSQRENYEALANYCSVLNKLEDSTVKQFFVTYINTAFKLVGVNKEIKVEHLEKAELIIKALCGDKEAGKELSVEVLGKLDDKYHELLKNFIKKNIPGGKEFLTVAEKLNKAREKRDDFRNKITEYAALSESEKTASNQFEITEKAYSELKSAYDSLSEIDILEGFFVPSTNWPSWF